MAGPTGRPLPVITEEDEFFWTSGADGRLRVTECSSCAALLHPPQPVCRYCRGHETGVRAVSGYATLIGFTVNHRFSSPGMPAPYIVAQVALEEDTRVRLTTNLVECEVDELELGMRLEVVFEHVEDVWLPLFRPRPNRGPGFAAAGRGGTRAHAAPHTPDGHAREVRGQGRDQRHRDVGDRA